MLVRGLLSAILVLLVARNFQGIQARSLPRRRCLTSIQIDAETPCGTVADLCGISLESLIKINQALGRGIACDGQSSDPEATMCCELSGGPLPDRAAAGTAAQQVQSTTTVPTTTAKAPTTVVETTTTSSTTQQQVLSTTVSPSTGDMCKKECPKVFDPVCGSDGVTYSSRCALENAACANPGSNIVFKSRGLCVPVVTEARKCPTDCADDFDPVCGNDGITYTNQCTLEMTACANPENELKVRAKGSCLFP